MKVSDPKDGKSLLNKMKNLHHTIVLIVKSNSTILL